MVNKYLENREWQEVHMWKALKLWANNKKLIKCVEGNSSYYYSGYDSLKNINHEQVTNGKWFVELA